MAYSRKQKKIHHKKRKNHKKSLKKQKQNGGGCGCSKIVGGSPYLSDLSPQSYYNYNNSIQNDPNNSQISTRMTDVPNIRSMTGGRNRNKKPKSKKQKQKKIGQRGGLFLPDVMNKLDSFGSNVNDPPTFLQNALSIGQTNQYSNVAQVTPGIKYLV
jgi:hypothetical protein